MTSPSPPSAPPRRTVLAVLYVALALAAYGLTTWVLAALVPRHVIQVDVKREYFAEHKDDYTTVFLGTSMVHRSIVPAEIDAGFSALGVEERSFNFGVNGMTFAEASLLLDSILASRPAKLRRVVFDANLFTNQTQARKAELSSRHIWWHTPEQTYLSVAAMLEATKPWSERLAEIKVELEAMMLNETATGRAAEYFRVAWDPGYIAPDVDDDPITGDGFRALDALRDSPRINRRKFLSRRRDFVRKAPKLAADLTKRRKKRRTYSEYSTAMLEGLVARSTAAGLEVVIYDPPIYDASFKMPGSLRRVPVVSFNDPKQYPEFYDSEQRHDKNHLNGKGARALSRAFAAKLMSVASVGP